MSRPGSVRPRKPYRPARAGNGVRKCMRLLVISAHPDDETLGAAGTILKYKAYGHKAYWLNVTNMKTEFGYEKKAASRRASEIKKVVRAYGFDGFFDLGLRPAGLDGYGRHFLIQRITDVFAEVRPEVVLLPFKNDAHSDHRIVFEAALPCTKIFRHPYVNKVLSMEVVSETDYASADAGFVPDYFVDITEYMEMKLKIAGIYRTEVSRHPFPRSCETLRAQAMVRGSQASCKYAEAFKVLKVIE